MKSSPEWNAESYMTESMGESSKFINHQESLTPHSEMLLGKSMSRNQLLGLLKRKPSPMHIKEQLGSYPSTPAISQRGVEEEDSNGEVILNVPEQNDRWENETIDEAQSVFEKTMSPYRRKQILEQTASPYRKKQTPTFDLKPTLQISQIDHLSIPGGNKSSMRSKRSNVSKISKSSALSILLDRAGVSGRSRETPKKKK